MYNLIYRIFVKPYREFMEDFNSKTCYFMILFCITVPIWFPIFYLIFFA